jgi:hypothetical protein
VGVSLTRKSLTPAMTKFTLTARTSVELLSPSTSITVERSAVCEHDSLVSPKSWTMSVFQRDATNCSAQIYKVESILPSCCLWPCRHTYRRSTITYKLVRTHII